MATKDNIKMIDGDYEDDDDNDTDSSNESVDFDDDLDLNESEEIDLLNNPPVKTVANIMNKLLSAKEDGQSAILSKAKIKSKESSDEDEDDDEDEDKREYKRRKLEKRKEKKELLEMSRIFPKDSTDREKERTLRVIATQGVVQLFSAINKHKVELRSELGGARSHHQRDKIYAKKGMDNFIGLLNKEGEKTKRKISSKSMKKEEAEEHEIKTESKFKSRWNALAQDYYKEPTMNEWDKYDSDES